MACPVYTYSEPGAAVCSACLVNASSQLVLNSLMDNDMNTEVTFVQVI